MSARWKKRIALLLMLVYTSQSIAAMVLTCDMDTPSRAATPVAETATTHDPAHDMQRHGMQHDHASMGHAASSHEPATDTAATAGQSGNVGGKADCCTALGHCLMGGCMIASVSNTSAFLPDESMGLTDLYALSEPFLLPSSHFRPPILS